MKECLGCGETKPLEDFNVHAKARLGRDERCRPCRSAYRKQSDAAYREKNRARIRERGARHAAATRARKGPEAVRAERVAQYHADLEASRLAHRIYMQQDNASTREAARRHGYEWTGPELEIAARGDLTARQVAEALGRTIHAVRNVRGELRTDPRKIRLAGIPLDPTA